MQDREVRLPVARQRGESLKEATQLSAKSYAAAEAKAAVGVGNPLVLDPLAGFPNPPYFNRKLKFTSALDGMGRIRLAAFTIGE